MKQHIKNTPFTVCLDMWRSELCLLLTLCGIMYSGAILGGYRASIYDIPYMVSIHLVETKSHKCGGSLITPRHVLTVAHTFRYRDTVLMDPNLLKVIAGVNFTGSAYNDEWSWGHDLQIRRVLRIVLHEEYEPYHTGLPNDVAILTVTREFYLTGAVQTIPLPTFKNTLDAYENINMTLAGYGKLQWNITADKHLWAVEIEVFNFRYCNRIAHARRARVLPDQNMCTREKRTPRTKNSCWALLYKPAFRLRPDTILIRVGCVRSYPLTLGCMQGDEGGPGVIDGTLIAMIFWPTCGRTHPGFHMRLDNYIDWVKNHTRISEKP